MAPVMLLTLLFDSGLVQGQSRSLFDVTTQQFPAGLPKLTNGAQAWGDYDKDGRQDLIISGNADSGYVTRLYHNTINGFVDQTNLIPSVPNVAYSTVTWGDYDGDGPDDLFITGWTGTKAISRLNCYTENSFEDKTDLLHDLPGLAHGVVIWSDYDEDGKSDLIVSGFLDNSDNYRFCQLYLNKGDDGFVKAALFPNLPQVGNSALSSADFNRDKRPDLLITGYNGSERISKLYLSTYAKGVYTEVTSISPDFPGVDRATLAVGDYDKDDLPDLMLTGSAWNGPTSKLYHNKPQWNNFEDVSTSLPGVMESALDWGDYDGDGRPDLVITGIQYQTANRSSKLARFGGVYHNTVDGFVDVTEEKTYGWLPQVSNGMVAFGDPDGDGKLELVVGGDQGTGIKDFVRVHFSIKNENQDDSSWPAKAVMSKGETITSAILNAALVIFADYLLPITVPVAIAGKIDLTQPTVLAPKFSGPLAYGSAQFINDPKGLGKGSLFLTGYRYVFDAVDQFQYATGNQLLTADNSPINNQMIKSIPFVGLSASDWADFNHDGLLDVAIIGRQGVGASNSLYVGTAGVYLQPNGQFIPLPGNPGLQNGTVDWGDYDGDGWADLLVTGRTIGTSGHNYDDYKQYTFLYHNEQGHGFTDATNLLPKVPGVDFSAAAWGDFDNDGRLDLMLTGRIDGPSPFSILYHNTINGFVDATSLLPGLPRLMQGTVNWVDFDHDGLLDLMVTGADDGFPATKLYRNKGYKSFFEQAVEQPTNLPGLTSGTADWVDYNADGRLDLLLTGKPDGSGPVTKLYSNTPAGFREPTLVNGLPQLAFGATAWGDYDGDGFGDLFLTGQDSSASPFSALLRNGSLGLPGVPATDAGWADYDNDGNLDLMMVGDARAINNGYTSILYHNTPAGLVDQSSFIKGLPGLGGGANLAWGDYDNDGRVDLALSGFNSQAFVLKLYHNTPSGFVDVSAQLPRKNGSGPVKWIDYDNDGKLDLFFGDNVGVLVSQRSKLFRNTGSGFADASSLLRGMPGISDFGSAAFGDYDGDGRPDLFFSNNGFNKLYHNTDTGFVDVTTNQIPNLSGNWGKSAQWGDYDNDGKLDLFVGGRINRLYHNTGAGFSDQTGKLPNMIDVSAAAGWGDYDSDGWLDLLVLSKAPVLYHNTKDGGFTATTLPGLPPMASGVLAFGEYNKDGKLDVLVTGVQGNGTFVNEVYLNESALANTAPGAPWELSSFMWDMNSQHQLLSWNKSTDAQTSSSGLHYNVYVGDAPGATNQMSPMADQSTGFRRVVRLGNVQNTFYPLTGLTPGKKYYWSVQAIDGAFAGGAFASEQSFVAGDLGGAEDSTWYRDADGDGWGNPSQIKLSPTQPKGYVSNKLDCNDKNKTVGGPEVCDGRDNDCDGIIDNGFDKKPFYSDWDGDGYGSPKRMKMACSAPPRYVSNDGDCNDDDSTVHPGAPELCDGKDNDCNGKIDDGLTQKPFYWDGDKDGYGFFRPIYACAAPRGYIAIGGDFNDNDSSIHPGATEHCDGVDENCNGIIDDGFVQKRFYKDRDGDGWGSNSNQMAGCAPKGYVERNGDCNDNDPSVHPGAVEIMGNGKDDNCNGQVDEASPVTYNKELGKTIGEVAEVSLQLTALPNPTTSYFTLCIQGNSYKAVQLRIIDEVGRLVEVRQNLAANTSVPVGHNYKPGVYYAQAVQGSKQASLKLVKTNR